MPSPPSSTANPAAANHDPNEMSFQLTKEQNAAQASFRAFVDKEIVPVADRLDREQAVGAPLIQKLARQGYLGAVIPGDGGGREMDPLTFGLLQEEFGRGSASLQSLLTVNGMVAHALVRWGTGEQKGRWLAPLAAGEKIAAFSLSEPETGSDAAALRTSFEAVDGGFVLNGSKKWISFAQLADLFLIIAQDGGRATAFIVERQTPGLTIKPIRDLLGFRAAMLGELTLDGCRVPATNLVGRIGCGLSHVVAASLDLGRYAVACGCVGLAQACLEASIDYACRRRQFGKMLKDHQLIGRMITRMISQVSAARLLCYRAGSLRADGDPRAIMETLIAKYFASTMVNAVAGDAVQIHGANGCGADYPVQRYFRDARIMEIIEGSSQIQEVLIARYATRGAEP